METMAGLVVGLIFVAVTALFGDRPLENLGWILVLAYGAIGAAVAFYAATA